MSSREKPRPTVEELVALIERSSLPTVLVEGKDDIIFYRSIEEDLTDLGIDMLPAGNKDYVLQVREKLACAKLRAPVVFVVDKDLWVYPEFSMEPAHQGVVLTGGYSIENDVFEDGGIIDLMYKDERANFLIELERFVFWYALAVDRKRRGADGGFRQHPGRILDDKTYYQTQTVLEEGEVYPEEFRARIFDSYGNLLRGKSLFGLVSRIFSAPARPTKLSVKQLMEIGARRKGPKLLDLANSIRLKVEATTNC